ncbi:MAG: phosphoglucosamine mutase [Ilumatobacteraceae bacterium]
MRFGTDGVRGVANSQLTPAYTLALGRAAARVLRPERVLIGRDTRRSGPLLEAALAAGLAAEGVDVELLGVLPTPAVAHAAAVEQVAAAVITASHNAFADNGIKLFSTGGRKLADDVEARIEEELATLVDPAVSGAEVGWIEPRPNAGHRYVEYLTSLFTENCLANLSLVLDCANGAMSEVAPLAVRRLGGHPAVLHAAPDGVNINADCGATSPKSLASAVVAHGAAMGLAFDGDGDRLIAVDHTGRVVDGDQIIALLARDLRERGHLAHDTVVVTVMSNLGFHRAMKSSGIEVVTTAVGDRYVLEALNDGGFSLGGEQSGHLIVPEYATTGDGLLAGLLLVDLVRRSGKSLADLAREVMTTYPQVLTNVKVAVRHPDVADLIAADIAAAEALLGDEGRVLVRPSGTEPLVRVMVEALDPELAQRCAADLARAVLHACV